VFSLAGIDDGRARFTSRKNQPCATQQYPEERFVGHFDSLGPTISLGYGAMEQLTLALSKLPASHRRVGSRQFHWDALET
jgi:hypothetical protein